MKYITTFNKPLYDTSGKDLLSTLCKYNDIDDIVVYTEGISLTEFKTVNIISITIIF